MCHHAVVNGDQDGGREPAARIDGERAAGPPCRVCGAPLRDTFVDLGMSPPCENYLDASQLDQGETFYPLHVRICRECLLVQLAEYVAPEDIFSHYAYFSSYSDSWVQHAADYVATAAERLGLGPDSFVVEVASNDGYLLQHVAARGIRCLGVEPAANVAEVAVAKGIPTVVEFLGQETGQAIRREHGPADLVAANNVYAHVPDIVDFGRGLRALVADDGYVTIEIPHLLRLIEGREYDTIYHEHFSYLSLLTTQRALGAAGLRVVDVEELPSHGGSLRTWSVPQESDVAVADSVGRVLAAEAAAGLDSLEGHAGFAAAGHCGQERPAGVPDRLLPRRPARRGVRGAGQGQHAAQPLRHPGRPGGVRGGPQHLQAREVPARDAHPHQARRGVGPGAPRRRADHAVEPATRDLGPAVLRARVVGPPGRGAAEARGLVAAHPIRFSN